MNVYGLRATQQAVSEEGECPMLFIGLLIALAAAVFVAVVLAEDWGGPSYTIRGFGHVLGSLTLAEIFLAGIIITAIFFVALWMASVSSMMRRRASARRRAENRSIREEHENTLAERDRLARELETERAGRASRPSSAPGTDPGETRVVELPPDAPAQQAERPTIDQSAAYPRDADVYGTRGVEPSNVDRASQERAISEEQTRRHTV